MKNYLAPHVEISVAFDKDVLISSGTPDYQSDCFTEEGIQ